MHTTEITAIATVTVAGFFRGVTGFGGAMMMTPMLSMLIGPIPAVAAAVSSRSAAAVVMFPDALPKVNWRTLSYLILPSILTVPLGGYFLLTINPALARKFIAAVVIAFSVLLLFGWRYSGSPRPITSIVLGSIVGVLLGATSVGAPPVILYLLSGPDPVAVTRANLTVFVTSISIIGLVMLVAASAITWTVCFSAILLMIPFLLATWFGGTFFSRLGDLGVRRFALGLMLALGVTSLVSS